MRHKFYAFYQSEQSRHWIGRVRCLLCFSIRYEMSYDAFRPYADRVYRIMRKDVNARGQTRNGAAHFPQRFAVHLRDEYPEVEGPLFSVFAVLRLGFRAEGSIVFNSAFVPVDGRCCGFSFGLDIIRGDAARAQNAAMRPIVFNAGCPPKKLYGNCRSHRSRR